MLASRTRWIALLLAVFLSASAQATVIEIVSLDDLVARSDLIVRGSVASTECKAVNGHIETTIHVTVTERWKGAMESDDLELTQMGGSISEPIPLTQAVPGLPAFAPKEDVVLFLSTKAPKVPEELRQRALAANGGQLPALWKSPRVVGGFQGKYNVYTDSKSKKLMVIRQSSLAAQGTDPKKMPPEVQARIASSVTMAAPGTKTLAADGSVAEGQRSVPVPPSAEGLDAFRAKIEKIVGPAEVSKAAASGPTKDRASAASVIDGPLPPKTQP